MSSCGGSEGGGDGGEGDDSQEEDEPGGLDLEALLAREMEGEKSDDDDDDDDDEPGDPGGCGGGYHPGLRVDHSDREATTAIAEQLAEENPLHSVEEVLGLAVEAMGGGVGGDVPAPAPSASSSSSDSSSSDSSPSEHMADASESADSDAADVDDEGAARAGLGRGPGLGLQAAWETIFCKRCGNVCGQVKLLHGEGRTPKFFMRVCDAGGSYESAGPMCKQRQTSMHADYDEVLGRPVDASAPAVVKACRKWSVKWVRLHRKCCG